MYLVTKKNQSVTYNTFLIYWLRRQNKRYFKHSRKTTQIEIQYSLDLLPNLRTEILQHQQLQRIIHKSVLKEQINSGRIIYNVTTISQIIAWKCRQKSENRKIGKHHSLSEDSAKIFYFFVSNLVQNTFHINHTNANEPTCLFAIKGIFLVQSFSERNGI